MRYRGRRPDLRLAETPTGQAGSIIIVRFMGSSGSPESGYRDRAPISDHGGPSGPGGPADARDYSVPATPTFLTDSKISPSLPGSAVIFRISFFLIFPASILSLSGSSRYF